MLWGLCLENDNKLFLLSNYFLGCFEAIVTDLVPAVTLENETLLSAFFIVFATVIAHIFKIVNNSQ